MRHQLGPSRGPRSEVQQHQRIGRRRRRGVECRIGRMTALVPDPARHRAADRDANGRAPQTLELPGQRPLRDDGTHVAAREAVLKVRPLQQGRRRNHYRAQLDGGQHGFPQGHHIAQHDEHPVARTHALRGEKVGDLIRAARQGGKTHGLIQAAVIDHPQRRPVIARRHPVEVVQRPIEVRDSRPAKGMQGLLMREALAQQAIAQFDECIAAVHQNTSLVPNQAPAHRPTGPHAGGKAPSTPIGN